MYKCLHGYSHIKIRDKPYTEGKREGWMISKTNPARQNGD